MVLKGFKRVTSEKNLKRFCCTYSSASASACWWSSKSIIVSASKRTFRISRRSSPPRAYRCRLHMGWRKTAVGRVILSSSVLHKPRPQFWTGVRCFPARPALVSTSERVKAIPVGALKSTTITTSEAALFGFIKTIARSIFMAKWCVFNSRHLHPTHTHSHQEGGTSSHQPAPPREQLPSLWYLCAVSSQTTVKPKETLGHLSGSWGRAPPTRGYEERGLWHTNGGQSHLVTKAVENVTHHYHRSGPGGQIHNREVANKLPWAEKRDWKRPLGSQLRSLHNVIGI